MRLDDWRALPSIKALPGRAKATPGVESSKKVQCSGLGSTKTSRDSAKLPSIWISNLFATFQFVLTQRGKSSFFKDRHTGNRRNLIDVVNELTRGYTVQHCASCIATLCIVHRVSGPWDLLGASCTSTPTSLKLLHFFWLTNKGYCARKLSTLASNYFVSFSEHMFDLTNRIWFSVMCTFIDNDTRHHSGQNVVDSQGALFYRQPAIG